MHHAHEDGAGRDGLAHIVRVNHPSVVHGQASDFRAQSLQEPARLKNGRMLDLGRDQVIAFVPEREERAFDGMVVRLRAATGEDNFARRAAEQRRDLAACCLQSLPRRRACPVMAGRVPVVFTPEWPHGLGHFRRNRRAGVTIKVDAVHGR